MSGGVGFKVQLTVCLTKTWLISSGIDICVLESNSWRRAERVSKKMAVVEWVLMAFLSPISWMVGLALVGSAASKLGW